MSGGTEPARVGRLQVAAPVADLCDAPEGARQRQLLFGEPVEVLDLSGEHAHVRAHRDGYTGWLRRDLLSRASPPTHRVVALATHLYERPDFKSRDVVSLSFGSWLTVLGQEGRFSRTREGLFVPSVHIAEANLKFRDPAGVAELFLGTPYLWGGNSRLGLDCSGLVQVACLACGVACPGDTGEQVRSVGRPLSEAEPPRRGDLIFWRGHVAMMTGAGELIHANAHHMSTVYETLEDAVDRIARQGDGAVTARRRPELRR